MHSQRRDDDDDDVCHLPARVYLECEIGVVVSEVKVAGTNLENVLDLQVKLRVKIVGNPHFLNWFVPLVLILIASCQIFFCVRFVSFNP